MLDGVGDCRHARAALTPGIARYPLYRRLGGPQGRFGRVQKISPPTGIRSPNRPTRRESLYRLRNLGPPLHCSLLSKPHSPRDYCSVKQSKDFGALLLSSETNGTSFSSQIDRITPCTWVLVHNWIVTPPVAKFMTPHNSLPCSQ